MAVRSEVPRQTLEFMVLSPQQDVSVVEEQELLRAGMGQYFLIPAHLFLKMINI